MDIEGASSLESLMGEPIAEEPRVPMHQQQQQPMPPLAPPLTTSTQEANPGSIAVADPNPSKSKSKTQKYTKDEIQKLALYVLVAAVVVSLPAVQEKLQSFIPMLQNGGSSALVINGALVAAVFYAILNFA